MPITLQKRSNYLCSAAHFRLLGADKDPQSQKSCKKSEIFVFATGRSPRQERDPTKNVWTPLEKAKAQTPPHKASRQNHTSQQGKQGRICEKYRALATTAGQNPRNSHESQRGQERPPQNPHGPQPTATGRISRRRAAIIGARKARQDRTRGPRYRYGAQDKEGSAETSRRTLLKR